MTKSHKSLQIIIVAVIGICLLAGTGPAIQAAEPLTSPCLNDGKKWRVGYYEGGTYSSYQDSFLAIINGLSKVGWISPITPPSGMETNRDLWQWLAQSVDSDYLEFVDDAFYSANWEKARREKLRDEIIQRLNKPGDIDLMIAMGTWAGQDLSTDRHHTPVIAASISDPIGSGIVKSPRDEGLAHIHARVDPRQYERQVETFHDIVQFDTLGIVYENTDSGRTYAAVDKVHSVAGNRGFDVTSCLITEGVEDVQVAQADTARCFRELADKADAIYVTMHIGVNSDSIPELVGIANAHGIPTFSQAGSDEVRQGFLMSISNADLSGIGRFHAEAMAKIFNGATPRELEMVFETPKKIAINLKTAEVIGFEVSTAILKQADEIFEVIPAPQ